MHNNPDETLETPSLIYDKARGYSPVSVVKTQNLRFPKDKKQEYKQHFQRFVMTVYHTVKKDRNKHLDDEQVRAAFFDVPDATLPKLSERDPQSGLDIEAEIEQALLTNTRGFPNPKYKVLKNFLNNYQNIKKKTQIEGMSLLGLQVKKLDCASNRRRAPARKMVEQPPIPELNIRQSMVEWQTNRKVSTLLECKGYSTRKQYASKQNSKKAIFDEEVDVTSELDQKQFPVSKVDLTERVEREQYRPLSLQNGSKTKYAYYHDKVMKGKLKFGQADNSSSIYESKMQSYRQFLFKVHFAHNVFTDLTKRDQQSGYMLKSDNKYRAWVGNGNNSLLIKGLLKRRFWWIILEDRSVDANFVWTQIKVGDIFKRQLKSKTQEKLISEKESESQEQETNKALLKNNRKRKIQIKDDGLSKLLCVQDLKKFRSYTAKYENKSRQKLQHKKDHIGKPLVQIFDQSKFIVHNHIENNFFLGNKKAMFHNLKQYYELTEKNVFDNLPLTFHIRNGLKCAQYKRFLHYYKKRVTYIKKQQKAVEEGELTRKPLRNIWIVKPGELSNRGNGITVIDEVYQLNKILSKKQQHVNGTTKTYIVQLYLDRPLLYNRRKFDIRHYMLITNLFGVVRGYWYAEGYVRTSSYEFDIFNFERQIHLTNDAVQKHTPLYGRYESGNKLSYSELQRYLDVTYPNKHYSINNQILPRMKEIGQDAVRSAFLKLSPNNLEHNFEILGLDFMIDQDFKPWLIEINTNPCLELSCPLLGRIIPLMVEQSLRLSLDVIYPPPCHYTNTNKHLVPDMSMEYLKYELIFDSLSEGEQIRSLYANIKLSKLMDQIGEVSEDEEYADDGQEVKLEDIN